MSDSFTTTADTLNVRQGAGTDHPVVTRLPKGTQVFRLETAGDWFRIRTDAGETGWISARFTAPEAAPAAPAGEPLRVTATTLNLRDGPGTDHAQVAQLPHGMIVQGFERSPDGWVRVRTPAGTEGWVSGKYLVEHSGVDPDAPRAGDAAWYAIAWGERGVREVAGPRDNPRIEEYQRATNYHADSDEVAWCSSFANWVMKTAGIRGTGLANARSWLDWGQRLSTPKRGAIVVLRRGEPWQGHVAFYVGERNGRLALLGGNQENQVKISYYDKSRLLSYRWPKD